MQGMPEAGSSRVRFGRLALEGAAIVVSILLAFAIDAAWQEREERDEERRMLLAVLDEFRENREVLAEARGFHQAVEKAEMELLTLASRPRPDLPADSVDELLGEMLWWGGRARFSTGALNSVVLGGRLHLITNEELRRELAGWTRVIEGVTEVEGQDYTTFHDDLMPFLRKNAYVAQISSVTTHRPGSSDTISGLSVPMRPGRLDHREILADPEFQNLLLQKWWVQWDVLEEYDGFEEHLDRVIALLEGELRRRE